MWELRQETLALLDARLDVLKPRRILEAGSGRSTAILSRHAETISLEHIPKYAEASRRLAPSAEVRLCQLRRFNTLGGSFRWYSTPMPEGIDFALIDGPPLSIGREAALFALWPHLSPGWEVWLDDADRPHEQECLEMWADYFRFDVQEVNGWTVRLNPHG